MVCLFQSFWVVLGGKFVCMDRRSFSSAMVWKMVLLCLMWCLWRERNVRYFEDLERSLEKLKSFF
jgi:hypothetical protein